MRDAEVRSVERGGKRVAYEAGATGERPVTRYAKTADGVSVAYQVVGNGPLDIVFLPDLTVPIDMWWEEPSCVRFAERLGRVGRTVWCEERGIGASGGRFSDNVEGENAVADITAVLDAVGMERVTLIGTSHSGPAVIECAAAHPDRVSALVLINTFAYYVREDGYPWGAPSAFVERLASMVGTRWGTGSALKALAPSKATDDAFRAWWARSQRLGIGRDELVAMVQTAYQRDVRSALRTLTVPTLVLHREEDRVIQAGAGRYLGQHVPGARYVELPGADHIFCVGDVDGLVDEIEEFLTGSRPPPEGDVVTTTILFTDIVASTQQATRMGHRNWTRVTDEHDTMVREVLRRHRGREVKTTGDGFLATFDASTRAVRAGIDIVAGAMTVGVEIRAGVHTGEAEIRPDDVVGVAVSISKRICDLAQPGEILVSRAVVDLTAGSGLEFEDRGEHELKGVPGTWATFAALPNA